MTTLEIHPDDTTDITVLDRPPAPPRQQPQRPVERGRRPRRRLRSAHVGLVVLLAVLVAVGVVHAWGMFTSPAPFDDEGTYMAQAWSVQNRGELAHYTYWYDHPPFGWLQIAAWTFLTDGFDRAGNALSAGRELMFLVHLASSGLLWLLGRRLGFTRVAAGAAVLAFGLSPLAVNYHRMVLLDNMALAWLLGALVLALSPGNRLWAYFASGTCLALAVVTKEYSLLFLPLVGGLVWTRSDTRTRRFCITAFFTALLLVGAAYPLFAVLKGELIPSADRVSLFDALRFQLLDRASTGSPLQPGSVSNRIVSDWLALDPWLLGIGIALVPVGVAVRRLRPFAIALGLLVLFVLRDGYLPDPYVIGLLPLCALVIAGVGDAAWRNGHRAAAGPGQAPLAVLAPLARVAVLGAIVASGAIVAPRWVEGDHKLMTRDEFRPVEEARNWVAANVPRDSRILIDDTLWVDLVELGFESENVVWFYKLDFTNNLDPSVRQRFPRGWREFDYVVSTPTIRSGLADQPDALEDVRAAVENSTSVYSWGGARDFVEVRRVDRDAVERDA